MISYAYCWRSGEISVGKKRPEGTLPIAHGPATTLRRALTARARHAYDGRTLLVPGIPEAPDDGEALLALRRFARFVTKGHKSLVPAFGEQAEQRQAGGPAR